MTVSLTAYFGGGITLQPGSDFSVNWRNAKLISVEPSVGGLVGTLADARHADSGMYMLVQNPSATAFDIEDYAGGAVATVGAGEKWELRLYSNATAAGGWLAKQV